MSRSGSSCLYREGISRVELEAASVLDTRPRDAASLHLSKIRQAQNNHISSSYWEQYATIFVPSSHGSTILLSPLRTTAAGTVHSMPPSARRNPLPFIEYHRSPPRIQNHPRTPITCSFRRKSRSISLSARIIKISIL